MLQIMLIINPGGEMNLHQVLYNYFKCGISADPQITTIFQITSRSLEKLNNLPKSTHQMVMSGLILK
jgi:hypothetical protein